MRGIIEGSNMYQSIYLGIVSSGGDPMQRGRVQINVPSVVGASAVWARTCSSPDSRGAYRSGQEVWVMFQGGNVAQPVVMGVNA
jgi:hypothetical protein